MAILTRGQQVDKYTVQSLLKENLYTETYRVENEDGTPYFMKVFVTKRMPEKLMNAETGNILEIEYSQKQIHKNIVSFIANGTIDSEEGVCQYYMTNYFSGELLAKKLQREGKIEPTEAMAIFRAVLEGFYYYALADSGVKNATMADVEWYEHQAPIFTGTEQEHWIKEAKWARDYLGS